MTRIRFLGWLAAAAVIFGVAAHSGTPLASDAAALRALDRHADGSPILNLVVADGPLEPPPITFTDEAGQELSLADYRGTPVVVHFWATWCFPCRAELPTMESLQRELGDDMVVLPLSLDRDGAPLVRAYYDDHGLGTLPVMIDDKMAAGRALRVHGIPATVFIDRDGAEVARVLGDRDWSDPAVVDLVRHIIQ